MTSRRLTARIGTSAIVAMMFFAMMVGLGRGVQTASAANKTIDVKQSTLSNPSCEPSSPNEWHFVINQIGKASNAPASITVTWDNGDTEVVPLEKFTGGVAHYTTTSNLGANVTSATASIYDKWKGQFNLSHGPCPPKPLESLKTATTSFIRSYTWEIEKVVLGDAYKEIPVGENSATFDYRVTVTRSAPVDSNYVVSGTITIYNPNAIAATIESVSDVVPGAVGAVTVNCDGPVPGALAPGGTLTCTYSASTDGSDGTNVATVTTSGPVPAGDPATAPVTFGEPTDVIDECVDVEDDRFGSLGQFCDTGSAEYSLTFTRGLEVPECGEGNVTNTATFTTNDTGTTGSSSATVTVNAKCAPPQWCSPGYWKNHIESWAATGISPDAKYNDYFDPDLPGNPSLFEVVDNPQIYGGPAANNVGDLLSAAHPGVNFTGERIENSCPLN